MTAKRESDLLITSMITDWIGQLNMLLPINQNWQNLRNEQTIDWALNDFKMLLWMLKTKQFTQQSALQPRTQNGRRVQLSN